MKLLEKVTHSIGFCAHGWNRAQHELTECLV